MTDWQGVIDADAAVPDGTPLTELVAELSRDLRSPDPVRRDQHAYSVLSRWISRGVLDAAAMRRLGDEMATRFDDPEIQTRTFAPLILAVIVSTGEFDPQWLEAFTTWYVTETDLRGHDGDLGWLHAVAHGADLLDEFGAHPAVDPAPLLELAARRMLAPTPHVWRDQEDDRLAFALAHTLTRTELSAADATAWLDAIAEDFAAGVPGPVPPYATNTMRTLRLLYIAVDRGVRPDYRGDAVHIGHRDAVKTRLAEVLALVAPFVG
ncbi:MAG TPA: DUF2785 domain-containing protein [Stackebrandtia sp.]|jgi:hypothetical protein|uniref:DUF2785 domain-containing protein n=1 Tax=Stackebrandtia sp. TaxID=2023065 RepID=UPI002D22C6EF|nr:DUF2785 domain-containing protein [Stackebrandtia sp.]HZE41468.1 DUF2785 domain-containing protein [Stackebrandtia sp.]